MTSDRRLQWQLIVLLVVWCVLAPLVVVQMVKSVKPKPKTYLKQYYPELDWKNEFIQLNHEMLSLSNALGVASLEGFILVDMGRAPNDGTSDTIKAAIQKITTNIALITKELKTETKTEAE